MVLELGKSIRQVARDLDLNAATLHRWVHQRSQTTGTPVGGRSMVEVEAETRRLRMENEFLKTDPRLSSPDSPRSR
jgi:transposase-like protein